MHRASVALVAALLFFAAGYSYVFKAHSTFMAAEQSPLPASLGQWTAVPSAAAEMEVVPLGFDHKRSTTYQNQVGEWMVVEVAYLERQTRDHSLVSQGKVLVPGAVVVPAMSSEGQVRVNQLVRDKGNRRRLSVFWYVLQGRVLAEPLSVRVLTAWNAVTRGRTDGALVVLTTDIDSGRSDSAVQAQSAALFQLVWPLIKDRLAPA